MSASWRTRWGAYVADELLSDQRAHWVLQLTIDDDPRGDVWLKLGKAMNSADTNKTFERYRGIAQHIKGTVDWSKSTG